MRATPPRGLLQPRPKLRDGLEGPSSSGAQAAKSRTQGRGAQCPASPRGWHWEAWTPAFRRVVKHLKRRSRLVIFIILSLVNGSFRAYPGHLLRVWAVNDPNPDLHINLNASCQGHSWSSGNSHCAQEIASLLLFSVFLSLSPLLLRLPSTPLTSSFPSL